jgi:hypothetical protein
LIAKSFEKTGLYPVNCSVFTPDDFAPSKASSSIAYVPETFPDDFPSSDPIDHSDDDQSSDSGSDSSDSDFTITTEPSDTTNDVELEDVEDPVDAMPQEPFSRFLATYANLESQVAHMTCSVSARHNLHTVEPPKTVSLEEDCKLSHEDLLKELRSVRQQLQYTHQAHGCALGLLSAANAHCTMVRQELSTVRIQLDSARKSKERGSTKVKACFVTSRDLCERFGEEDAALKERDRIAEERQKQKEVETAEHERCVADHALNRVFTGRMSSYKKNDFWALAIALGLSDKGTNMELLS